MKDYIKRALETMADQDFILDRLYTDDSHSQIKSTLRMQLINGTIGLQDETGEISGAVKRHIEYGQPLDVTNLKEEVGDAFWRLAQICDAVGLTFEECMEANLAKLQGKKGRYEKGYSEEAAKEENRDRAAERKILETETHSLCPHQHIDMGGQEILCGTEIGTCMQCGKKVPANYHNTYQRSTQVPLEDQPMTDPGDPYIQTGAGWAEPAEVDESSGTIGSEAVSIAVLREWAALVDNNIPDCKLSNQIKQAALNQGIPLHLIQACSSWSEVVDLMEKKPQLTEEKPIIEELMELAKKIDSQDDWNDEHERHSIKIRDVALEAGIHEADIDECCDWVEVVQLIKKGPKPKKETALAKAIRRKEFTLARRIADTYLEGQNKTRALAEIARAEKEFNNG